MNKRLIAERLERIAAANDGRLTPDAVVADARNSNSPLHHLFEWDVDKAAEQHWLSTARKIISSVEVVVKHEHISVKAPAYVRDPGAGEREQGYVSTAVLRRNGDIARESLISEIQKVADLLRRAEHVAAVLGLGGEVRKLINAVIGVRETARVAISQKKKAA